VTTSGVCAYIATRYLWVAGLAVWKLRGADLIAVLAITAAVALVGILGAALSTRSP
jgi:hypothetical protein